MCFNEIQIKISALDLDRNLFGASAYQTPSEFCELSRIGVGASLGRQHSSFVAVGCFWGRPRGGVYLQRVVGLPRTTVG